MGTLDALAAVKLKPTTFVGLLPTVLGLLAAFVVRHAMQPPTLAARTLLVEMESMRELTLPTAETTLFTIRKSSVTMATW